MNLISNETVKPFDFVLFGGTGDLSIRKLIPALYFRHCENQLPLDGRIIAVARTDYDTESFKKWIDVEVREHISEQDFNEERWASFLERVMYFPVDVTDAASYQALADTLAGRESHVRVFYLSVAPSLFTHITDGVQAAGLITPDNRLLVNACNHDALYENALRQEENTQRENHGNDGRCQDQLRFAAI